MGHSDRDRLRAKLAIARSKLALMGPPARDLTAADQLRRRELEQTIVELEAGLGVQLALPDVADPDDVPVDPAGHHDEQLTVDDLENMLR